jgi:hypothetical protein
MTRGVDASIARPDAAPTVEAAVLASLDAWIDESEAEIKAREAAYEELRANLADPIWRLSNLYKIMVKGEDGEDDLVLQFKPNRAQRRFLKRLWSRNIILKARQLGFTTLIAIVWLDHALFNRNVRCGIIAQDREAAEVIFRDKVKFAYENLPDPIRLACPLEKDSATELLFAHNNSSIRVATSMRSGTIHRLHVSEFGKICAKYPDKAKEVVTGSLPAVPQSGIVVIESTAEGQDGEFYTMTQRALAFEQQGRQLGPRDYRMHFFPWWQAREYVTDPSLVVMTEKDAAYFHAIEGEIGRALTDEQRAWYVATRDGEFHGDPSRMWQEYPSTPQEAFQVSTEGCYYANVLSDARKQGRILRIPILAEPVNTFWDLGQGDATAVWFHQWIGKEHRFIRYHEASGESLAYWIKYLQDTGYIFNRHYLPHDAAHKHLSDTNRSIAEQLEDKGMRGLEIVPRISDIGAGINLVREHFAQAWFDEEGCAEGLKRLGGYRKQWNSTLGAWRPEPAHDDNSHGSDAFRQWAQALDGGLLVPAGYSVPSIHGNGRSSGRGRRPGSWRAA